MAAILLGACILIFFGVIDLRIPGSYLLSFVLFLGLFGGHGFELNYIFAHLAGGGLMLGAFFMATDYVTTPMSRKGQIVFAVGCGILTVIIRRWSAYPEGVSFAILIMNAFVPLIDYFTVPRVFGTGRK